MKFKIPAITFLLFFSLCVNAENISVNVGYPVMDEMEIKVTGTAYPQANIYKRLDALEMRLFGNVTNAPLSDRVDRLKDEVLGKNKYSAKNKYSYGRDHSVTLYELEKKLLGTVYITEPVDNRLARLEKFVFNKSSDSYSTEERLQRLCAYTDARESGHYYDNQAQLRQYNNMANNAKMISILFMILQFLL